MSDKNALPLAGWYVDPVDSSGSTMRYWSGVAWTNEIRPKLSSPSGEPIINIEDQPSIDSGVPSLPDSEGRRGLFGGKKELESENEELRNILNSLGVEKRDLLRRELEQLTARVRVAAAAVTTGDVAEPIAPPVVGLHASKVIGVR